MSSSYDTHVENPDVILIGGGIMSANLGAMLKKVSPDLTIQLYEVSSELAQESSFALHNAGTGHAGICEFSYTPSIRSDGTVDVSKAIDIFGQFELSKLFWGYALKTDMIQGRQDFINPVPHMSFVTGEEAVRFLRARFQALTKHHFFHAMEFTTDRERIRHWTPLLVEGREDLHIAATKMDNGTDVNFGALARKLVQWLSEQPDCGVATNHRVTGLKATDQGWIVAVQTNAGRKISNRCKFVFIGAGGGALQLLQLSGVAEGKGFGGFPIGGQWLVCDNPSVVDRHYAKVYGLSPRAAPSMAAPHLDRRIINGRSSLMFGPFAAWTSKFLRKHGSVGDLPFSMRPDNAIGLLKVGISNLSLVQFLVQQGTQSMSSRMQVLRGMYPEAKDSDWQLIDAGIRVQAITRDDGREGRVHYGTKLVTNANRTLSALLGASPGASVSVSLMLQVIETCFPHLVASENGMRILRAMFPCYGDDIRATNYADQFGSLDQQAEHDLFG